MQSITINIFKSENEEGYMYNIYIDKELDELESSNSEDGGLCTTTIKNALEMATQQTKDLLTK